MKGFNAKEYERHLKYFSNIIRHGFLYVENTITWLEINSQRLGIDSQAFFSPCTSYFSTQEKRIMDRFEHLYEHLFLWSISENCGKYGYIREYFSSNKLVLWNEEFGFRLTISQEVYKDTFYRTKERVNYISKTSFSLEFIESKPRLSFLTRIFNKKQ